MVLPKHTYRDWLKNVAKTAENHYHLNEVKNLEIVNNQYLVYSIKSGTRLTCGGINDSDVLLLLICPLGQLAYVPRYHIWRSILISLLTLIRFVTIWDMKIFDNPITGCDTWSYKLYAWKVYVFKKVYRDPCNITLSKTLRSNITMIEEIVQKVKVFVKTKI